MMLTLSKVPYLERTSRLSQSVDNESNNFNSMVNETKIGRADSSGFCSFDLNEVLERDDPRVSLWRDKISGLRDWKKESSRGRGAVGNGFLAFPTIHEEPDTMGTGMFTTVDERTRRFDHLLSTGKRPQQSANIPRSSKTPNSKSRL